MSCAAGRKGEEASRFEARRGIVVGLLLAILFAWSAVRAHDATERLGWALASLSGLLFARSVRGRLWPDRPAPDTTPEATARFYRGLLEKRRDFDRRVWGSGLPLAFIGIAIVLIPPLTRAPELLPKAAPFLVLLAVWLAALFPIRRRTRQALQREIDELSTFERDNAV